MKIDQDFGQRIKVMGIFSLQFYKVLMGTMLSLFVPQACYEEIGDGSEERSNLQICTLTQNYENSDIYHQITLSWNTLSFVCFVFCYVLELRRENWAIKFLDIDNDKPDNSLKQIIILEPKLDKQMDKLNKIYFYGLSITAIIYFINVCLMINILLQDYHSMSTISCFISFVLLVQMKLYNSLSIAYQSVKSDKMMSAFMSEFVSYNVLDSDYIVEHSLKSVRP
jgi:hypothetical protein